jgi:hypothetical protein
VCAWSPLAFPSADHLLVVCCAPLCSRMLQVDERVGGGKAVSTPISSPKLGPKAPLMTVMSIKEPKPGALPIVPSPAPRLSSPSSPARRAFAPVRTLLSLLARRTRADSVWMMVAHCCCLQPHTMRPDLFAQARAQQRTSSPRYTPALRAGRDDSNRTDCVPSANVLCDCVSCSNSPQLPPLGRGRPPLPSSRVELKTPRTPMEMDRTDLEDFGRFVVHRERVLATVTKDAFKVHEGTRCACACAPQRSSLLKPDPLCSV